MVMCVALSVASQPNNSMKTDHIINVGFAAESRYAVERRDGCQERRKRRQVAVSHVHLPPTPGKAAPHVYGACCRCNKGRRHTNSIQIHPDVCEIWHGGIHATCGTPNPSDTERRVRLTFCTALCSSTHSYLQPGPATTLGTFWLNMWLGTNMRSFVPGM